MLLILYVGVNNHQDTTDSLTGTKLESVYGDVGQDLYYGLMRYVGIDVAQPNWQKVIWGSRPIWPVYLIVKCNDGAVVPQPYWYQD